MNFDATSREFCTSVRVKTNTPWQALTTLNDEAFIVAARGLARLMAKEFSNTDRIKLAFNRALTRDPSKPELATLLEYVSDETAQYETDTKAATDLTLSQEPYEGSASVAESAALVMLANVILNTDEFITRE